MSITERAKLKEDGSAEYSTYFAPSDGKHLFRFNDGIKIGEITQIGTQSIHIPLVVDDQGDPDNGAQHMYFITIHSEQFPESVRTAEGYMCKLLVQTGLSEEVDKSFNSPENLFDPKIVANLVDMLSVKLPGRYIQLELKTVGKNQKIIGSWPVTGQKAPTQTAQTAGSQAAGKGFQGAGAGMQYG